MNRFWSILWRVSPCAHRRCCCLAFFFLVGSQAWAQPLRVNLAKFQLVQASSAAATDPALYATDGVVGNGNRWKSNGNPPHWLIVTLPFDIPLGSAQLYLGRDDLEPVASFRLQSWNGATWIDIPGTVISGNTSNVLNLVFPSPVTTSQVRFYSTEPIVRLREFALFTTNGPTGYPIGADVTLNLAKKRPVIVSSVDANNYGKGAVDGYVEDNLSSWKSAIVNGPHTLDVDLLIGSRLGSAHLYSGSSSGPPVSNFTFQAWSGSAWTNIPGGSVTGNTNPALRVNFASPADTKKLALLIPVNATQRVP